MRLPVCNFHRARVLIGSLGDSGAVGWLSQETAASSPQAERDELSGSGVQALSIARPHTRCMSRSLAGERRGEGADWTFPIATSRQSATYPLDSLTAFSQRAGI